MTILPRQDRPTKPFKGKVIVEITFDAADPNGDSRAWYWPEEIRESLAERILEKRKEILIQNDHGGIMHESWVRDADVKVTIVEQPEGVE